MFQASQVLTTIVIDVLFLWPKSFMFFRLPNYTYLNGLDFLITISAGMNGILVFHLRPLKTSLSGHE